MIQIPINQAIKTEKVERRNLINCDVYFSINELQQ